MPRLKQYSDRRGFYLSGHVPGVGFCTWQIGDEGLAHLASRGIGSNNDILPIDELRDMIVRGLVGTAGSGTSPSPPAPSPEWVKTLADCLIAWSLNGGTDALAKLVCPGSGAAADSRSRCFAASFLAWMEGLDEGTGLVRFAGISAAEFETMAIGDRHELENDPLFRYLIDRGAVGVLWRLSRLCGSVAVRLQAGSECPNEWQADMLLLWLFNRIKECEDRRRTSTRLTGKRRLVAWTSPRIVWAVDVQEVHALLPSQLLPTGVSSVVWTVGQRKTIYPLVRPGPRGRQIEERLFREKRVEVLKKWTCCPLMRLHKTPPREPTCPPAYSITPSGSAATAT